MTKADRPIADESQLGERWRVFDDLLDAVFVVDSERRMYFANEIFHHLCDLPRRAISNHECASKYIELPVECWGAVGGASADSELRRYREVDFRLKTGQEGRMQVLVDRVREPAFSDQELYIFILRDVTVEARLHAKYKAQIASNEHLIGELQRNLSETAFLRGLAMDLPIYADTSALLIAISKRLKGELGFRDAQFFRQQEGGPLEAVSLDQRIGSRIREVIRLIEPLMKEASFGKQVASFQLEPYGTFWVAYIKPRQEQPVLLVASPDHRRTNADFRSLLGALSGQVNTLLENRALYVASITDNLTGLFNRRFFDSRLGIECVRAKDQKAPVSLILIDIDYFKNVNDVYGHPAGDAVLARMGAIIKKRIRSSDFGARVGGEEFALLLPETSPNDAWVLAEQLRKQIGGMPITVPGTQREILVTLSCGIAGCPWPNEEPEDLYQAADSALYRAKQLGRNRSIVDDGVSGIAEDAS